MRQLHHGKEPPERSPETHLALSTMPGTSEILAWAQRVHVDTGLHDGGNRNKEPVQRGINATKEMKPVTVGETKGGWPSAEERSGKVNDVAASIL